MNRRKHAIYFSINTFNTGFYSNFELAYRITAPFLKHIHILTGQSNDNQEL